MGGVDARSAAGVGIISGDDDECVEGGVEGRDAGGEEAPLTGSTAAVADPDCALGPEVQPVVVEQSPEDRLEEERKERRDRARGLAIALALILA